MPATDTSTYRTIAQAADARPWASQRYLRRLIYDGRLAHRKIGGKVLIDLADLDALVLGDEPQPPTR